MSSTLESLYVVIKIQHLHHLNFPTTPSDAVCVQRLELGGEEASHLPRSPGVPRL